MYSTLAFLKFVVLIDFVTAAQLFFLSDKKLSVVLLLYGPFSSG